MGGMGELCYPLSFSSSRLVATTCGFIVSLPSLPAQSTYLRHACCSIRPAGICVSPLPWLCEWRTSCPVPRSQVTSRGACVPGGGVFFRLRRVRSNFTMTSNLPFRICRRFLGGRRWKTEMANLPCDVLISNTSSRAEEQCNSSAAHGKDTSI